MRQLLERPPSLRPRGLLIAGPYHNGKTMIAERFAVPVLQIPLLPGEVQGLEMLIALGEQVYGPAMESAVV